ncbi:OsmC family protein [Paraburkholderia caffeinilytica]|uniref:OsmC family protein n=1 Tax=Paraburkholderia caffeinilytica TaxID=1761016 RepID=UPI0038B81674
MSLATVIAELDIDAPDYLVKIEVRNHALLGDEGLREGGQGRGPAPFAFVLSGLVACTAATLRMNMQAGLGLSRRPAVRLNSSSDERLASVESLAATVSTSDCHRAFRGSRPWPARC